MQSQSQADQATQAEKVKLMAYQERLKLDLLAEKQRHIWKMEEIALQVKLDLGKQYLLKEDPIGAQPAPPQGGPSTQGAGDQPQPQGPRDPRDTSQDGGPDVEGAQEEQQGQEEPDPGAVSQPQ